MPETQSKKSSFERTKELTDRLEAGMKDLFQSDKYRDFLKTMSHFHHYSRRNIMLINLQMPGATRVASYKLWKDKLNRQVKKGEEGIRIFAPIKDKGPEKKLMEKLDPETGAPLLDANGNVVMEEMTALTNGVRFKLVPVFDVSQTYGEPLPELTENLTGNVENYNAFMDALKDVSPLPIEFEPMNANQDGYCRFGEKIGIREGMGEIQTVAAAIHEITHGRLHDRAAAADNAAPKSKVVKEVEAESVAYVVAQHFGIETSPNSFGYLAEYGSRDLKELNASLDIIRKEANSLINAIGDRFGQICKERGIDLSAKKADEHAAPVANPEPPYTAETQTENIAGVDFEVTEIKPQTPLENEAAKSSFSAEEIKEMEIYQFAADYTDHITDVHGAMGRMDKAEREDAINGIADLVQKGNIVGIQEALGRSLRNSKFPEQSAALSERLNMMFQQPQAHESEAAKAPPRPEADENMPDPDISIAEMNIYGYQYEGMLPLTLEKAMELYDNDQPIYLLYPDGSEAMAIDRSEIEAFDGIFGIDRGEWERALEYSALSYKNIEAAKESGNIDGAAGMFGNDQIKDAAGNKPLDQPVEQRKAPEAIKPDNNKQAQENKARPPLPGNINLSVYMKSPDHARENNELDKYHESNRLNKECANAIDAAIKDCIVTGVRGYRLTPEAASKVIDVYGEQRLCVVLANTVRLAEWDGRYSKDTKDWAKAVEMPEVRDNRSFFSSAHPAVLDGYINMVRKEMDDPAKKPSILDALKQGADKIRRNEPPQKEIPDKKKGLEV